MWFITEQINSFLNLGICKEYPKMARSKSTSGGKTNRPNNESVNAGSISQEQAISASPVNVPEVKAVAAETVPSMSAPETTLASETRKFEIKRSEPRKSEARKNVIPINLEDEIRRRAYELYQQRGPASGSEAEDWLTAEREVRQRYHQQSA
jgi:hypothetical protein